METKWSIYKRHSRKCGRCVCSVCLEIERWQEERAESKDLEVVRRVYREAEAHFSKV